MKPPVIVRIQGPTWEAVVEVPGIYGDAGGVAARMRLSGILCKRSRKEVLVNANHIPENIR